MPRVAPPDLPRLLLQHLQAELGAPGVDFSDAPIPVGGGYDTEVFAFSLFRASGPFAEPLILRLLGTHHAPTRALRERTVQNVVAGLGYPVPRVLSVGVDPAVLGGAFLVMERVPGQPLIEVKRIGIAALMAHLMVRLHDLDARVLLDALTPEERAVMTFEGFLGQLGSRVTRGSLEGLSPAMAWLSAHRPPEPPRPVICHGDFHPFNILMSEGNVTGVVDWPNAVIADPAYDVAATRSIISTTPVELFVAARALRPLVRLAGRNMVARFTAAYRRRRPLHGETLAYYEAASTIRGLVRVAEARKAAARGEPLSRFDASSVGDALCRRFARLTGVRPTLPPVPE